MLTKLKFLFSAEKIICTNPLIRWKSSSPVGYEIVEITGEYTDRVIDFLKTHYFPDNPVTRALGYHISKIEIDEAKAQTRNGLSRMAIDKQKNQLLGVTLNEIYTKEMTDSVDEKIKVTDEKDPDIHYLRLWKRLNEESKFWERLGVNRCLRSSIICSDRKYRRMKLGYNLLESCKTVSNEKYIRGEASTHYTYKIAIKQGWKLMYEINYQDYRDKNNQIILQTEPPNTHLRLILYVRDDV